MGCVRVCTFVYCVTLEHPSESIKPNVFHSIPFPLFVLYIYSLFITVFATSFFVTLFFYFVGLVVSFFGRFSFVCLLGILFIALSHCILNVSTCLAIYILFAENRNVFMFLHSILDTTNHSKCCVFKTKKTIQNKNLLHTVMRKDDLALILSVSVIYFVWIFRCCFFFKMIIMRQNARIILDLACFSAISKTITDWVYSSVFWKDVVVILRWASMWRR